MKILALKGLNEHYCIDDNPFIFSFYKDTLHFILTQTLFWYLYRQVNPDIINEGMKGSKKNENLFRSQMQSYVDLEERPNSLKESAVSLVQHDYY